MFWIFTEINYIIKNHICPQERKMKKSKHKNIWNYFGNYLNRFIAHKIFN